MSINFEDHFNQLTKELNRITKNINLVKRKSHDSISKIINNIKDINNNSSKVQLENKKTNYNNIRPIIYLYPSYKKYKKEINNEIHSKTINNFTITRSKFFLNKNSIINIKKNSYNKANTIDFNSNYNLDKSNSSSLIYKRKIKTSRNITRKNNKKIYIYNKNDINKILNFNYNNNQEFNKMNKNHINFPDEYFRTKYKHNKNYNSINVTKITRHNNYFRRHKEKKFLNQMCKIYDRYNDSNKINASHGYDKIIIWIKDLVNKKEINEENNKYENFCKKLMKENNINDFSAFQSFAKSNINEEKNANFFFKDIKKILFKDDVIN